MTGRYALALDVGGTFTDVILVEGESSRLWTTKTATTPSDPATGFFDGVDKILELSSVPGNALKTLSHGTTIATNAILEGNSAKTGMLVTDGFKYVLEIGRAEVPRKENLYAWVKPTRPVRPRFVREAPERMLFDGSVERRLDEDACRAAAREFGALGIESVAIVFLHSYANPAHERRAAEILREELPEVELSLSSDVLPVFREYERAMATALNAGLQPLVGRYIGRLEAGQGVRGINAPFYVMKSNGGVFSPARATRQCIHMALSGPAAGVQGAAYVAQAAGYLDLITVDIGGTSADVSLIQGGMPSVTKDGEIGPFPLSIPIMDIHTIGAGGGSIAAVTEQGGLIVGPRSAGADPGPACYGKGGTAPTVTDANLVLGRIPPHLLDGETPLDPNLAERAIETEIAAPLGLSVTEAAHGILAIVNNNMIGALKVVSVEKGYDPRDFTLCAFGGAGPAQAGELARLLDAPRILVPRHPGILCALGLLATDLQYDFLRTRIQRPPGYDFEAIKATYDELHAEAEAHLTEEGVPEARRSYARSADLRYAKQGVEITVDWPGNSVDRSSVARLVADFHEKHERLYTFADYEAPVEIVNFNVSATGAMDRIALPELDTVAPGTKPSADGERRASFENGAFATTPTYRRENLCSGHMIEGPAIVDQLDATTVVFPGQGAAVDRHGNLIISERRS
jgi:N-methylhydantoinase A